MRHSIQRSRVRGGFVAGLGLAAGLSMAIPAVPVAAAGTVFQVTSVSAKPAISGAGTGWRLVIDAGPGGSGPSFTLRAEKKNAAGSAVAGHQTSVSEVTFTCGAKLGSCVLDDDGRLGTYGEVDLAFTATKPMTVLDETCPDGVTVTGIIERRTGVLEGTMRLATKAAKLGTIRNGAGAVRVPLTIPAVARRYTSTAEQCPTKPPCPTALLMNTTPSYVGVSRSYGQGTGSGSLIMDLPSVEPAVRRLKRIAWKGSAGDVMSVSTKTTLAGATIHTAPAAPFLAGSITFTATSPIELAPLLGCPGVRRTGQVVVDAIVDLPWASPVSVETQEPATLRRLTS